VGKGISALRYFSRYLYRGVTSEKNIVSNRNGKVSFRYSESKTGIARYRTLQRLSYALKKAPFPKEFLPSLKIR